MPPAGFSRVSNLSHNLSAATQVGTGGGGPAATPVDFDTAFDVAIQSALHDYPLCIADEHGARAALKKALSVAYDATSGVLDLRTAQAQLDEVPQTRLSLLALLQHPDFCDFLATLAGAGLRQVDLPPFTAAQQPQVKEIVDRFPGVKFGVVVHDELLADENFIAWSEDVRAAGGRTLIELPQTVRSTARPRLRGLRSSDDPSRKRRATQAQSPMIMHTSGRNLPDALLRKTGGYCSALELSQARLVSKAHVQQFDPHLAHHVTPQTALAATQFLDTIDAGVPVGTGVFDLSVCAPDVQDVLSGRMGPGLDVNEALLTRIGQLIPKLKELTLSRAILTQAGLQALADGCKELRGLHLINCDLDQQAMVAISMEHLQSLSLSECAGVDDTALGLLTGASIRTREASIRTLDLYNTSVTAACLAGLSRSITDLGVSDVDHMASIEGIQGMALDSLDISGTNVVDLAPLAGVLGLVSFSVGHTRVTDAQLAHLAQLIDLKTLSLEECRIGDVGMSHLAALQLNALTICGTQVTHVGLGFLQPTLEELVMHDTGDVGDLKVLARFTRLRFLTLDAPRAPESLFNLPDSVEELILTGANLTDDVLQHVWILPQLQHLHYDPANVTAAGVAALQAVCPDLAIQPWDTVSF